LREPRTSPLGPFVRAIDIKFELQQRGNARIQKLASVVAISDRTFAGYQNRKMPPESACEPRPGSAAVANSSSVSYGGSIRPRRRRRGGSS
jgi:hypothetical protein